MTAVAPVPALKEHELALNTREVAYLQTEITLEQAREACQEIGLELPSDGDLDLEALRETLLATLVPDPSAVVDPSEQEEDDDDQEQSDGPGSLAQRHQVVAWRTYVRKAGEVTGDSPERERGGVMEGWRT